MTRYVQFQIATAVIGALFAGLMWFAFLRQVPTYSARGRVAEKEPFGPRTVRNQTHGSGSLYWNPSVIQIPGGFRFGIEVPGEKKLYVFGLDSVTAKEYPVGQDVEFTYEKRGIPPLWVKLQVLTMKPATDAAAAP